MSESKDNVPAGSHVVILKEVRASNDAIIHARGAVAVVTRTPTGNETHYLVRFSDGFEGSLVRDQFDVLKSPQGLTSQGQSDKDKASQTSPKGLENIACGPSTKFWLPIRIPKPGSGRSKN